MIAPLTNLVSIKRVAAVMVSSVMALCTASGQAREQKPATIADLRNAIEAVSHETRTPGAGIAIVSRDEIEWAAGLGVADVARKPPATAETLFRIGSISKSFAALAALRLQEEGKLKLSDTLKQWLPEVAFENPWESTDPVRLVHLMEHTTGFDDCHLREWAFAPPIPARLLDGLAYGARSRVCRWRPGTRMAYCNSGPAVLAAVIEKVSGQRKENQSVATLALLPDEDGKVLVQSGWVTFKKVSALRIWSQAAGIGLVSGLVLSSVLFAPVWVGKMIFGKLRNGGPLSVRVMPLLGAAFLMVFDGALAIGMRGVITRSEIDDLTPLGTPSALAITITLSSIAFALATVASLYVLYRERTAAMNRVVYWHSLAVAGGLLGVAIYYGYWGLLGVRLWAY